MIKSTNQREMAAVSVVRGPAHPRGVSVRLLSPMGCYPRSIAFRYADAALVVEKDLIAVVTKFSPLVQPDDYYSEVEFLTPFEVRALAPVLLAMKPETGAMTLYPVWHEYCEIDSTLDLSDRHVLSTLLDRFRCHLNELPALGRLAHPLRGLSYDFTEHCEIDRRRLPALIRSIDVSDHLVIRGLGSLLKGGMLRCHPEFLEQACMSLWIALDASLRIIQRTLRELGHVNPTARDAGEFLDDAFDSKYASDGYFEDYYVERIKTLHPESRFGVFPGAPLCADEFYYLNQSLAYVYDFLLTGHVYKSLKGH